VGLGTLSFEEERFHFSLWAINKSPLVIGAPMDKTITPQQSLDILSNEEIIAIDQDSLAEQAKLIRRYTEEQYDIWAGNLTGDRYVVAVLNWANTSASVNISLLNTIGLANANATRDVWLGKDLGALDGSKELHLELVGHEAKILVLSCVELIVPPPKSRGSTYYSAANATLQNGANITDCSSTPHYCLPTESKVSNLNGTASVMFENVNVAETTRGNTAAALTRVVGVDFINYDIAFTTGDNTRNLTIQVNGGPIKRWAFPISGGDWYETGRLDVELSGFVDGVNNTIVLGAYGTHAAPDIVGLEVYA
jgi:alpha-galactosidase